MMICGLCKGIVISIYQNGTVIKHVKKNIKGGVVSASNLWEYSHPPPPFLEVTETLGKG